MVGELFRLVQGSVDVLLDPLVWPVRRLRDIAAGEPMIALLLLLALCGCTLRAIGGDRLAALALVPVSIAWVMFNGPIEGPVLLTISSSHGVTVSDLMALAGLTISVWRLAPVLIGGR